MSDPAALAAEHPATLQSYLDATPVARGRLVDGRMVVDEVFDAALWDRFVRGRFALDVVVDDGPPTPVFAGPLAALPSTARTWVAVNCRSCGRHLGEWAGVGGAARFRCCRCKARTIYPWPPPIAVPE